MKEFVEVRQEEEGRVRRVDWKKEGVGRNKAGGKR